LMSWDAPKLAEAAGIPIEELVAGKRKGKK
jgi:hypothetical protein